MKTISKSISKARQSIDYKEILKLEDAKLRILIKSDSYEHQCYARIEKWDGDKWHTIDSIHYADMSTPNQMAYMKFNQPLNVTPNEITRNNEQYFSLDRKKLLAVALEVLTD